MLGREPAMGKALVCTPSPPLSEALGQPTEPANFLEFHSITWEHKALKCGRDPQQQQWGWEPGISVTMACYDAGGTNSRLICQLTDLGAPAPEYLVHLQVWSKKHDEAQSELVLAVAS
uniref:Uncharacterized protein n=1 Tax=Sphaerodactylus townsendi TaxID=933632 RepID=A0ACB8F4I9_9SAUR